MYGVSLLDYFDYSEAYFKDFLSDPKNMENKKSEYFIPLMVNKLINDGYGNSESTGYDEQMVRCYVCC